MLDISDWGFFRFHGLDAKSFLQGLMTADMKALRPGAMLPSCVLTPKGLMVADCELYEKASDAILAVTRPAAAAGFQRAFEKKIMLSKSSFERLHPRAFLIIGEGFDGGLPWPRLAEPARLLLDEALPPHVASMPFEEFHALRVAAGFPWFGADMDEQTLPLEARQEAAISMDKGCYMGQETVSRLVRVGHVNRILVGLRFSERAPTVGAVLGKGGRETGKVTSVAGPIGLGMVRLEDSASGAILDADGARAEIRAVSLWPAPLTGV